MTATFDETVTKATAKFLQKPLWAVFSRPTDGLAAMQPHVAAHLAFVTKLSAEGRIFAAGPFTEDGGSATGEGMLIMRAESRSEAEAVASDDPFHRAGVRSYEVRKWICNVGWVAVELNYADQTFKLS